MPRNLYNRVELVDPDRRRQGRGPSCIDVLDRSLADNTNAWELGPDGDWTRRTPERRAANRPARADRAPHRARSVGRSGGAPDRLAAWRATLRAMRAPRRTRVLARRGRAARGRARARRRAHAPTWSSSAAATPGCGRPGTSSSCEPGGARSSLLEADALRRGAERAATAASSTRSGSASRTCAGASATRPRSRSPDAAQRLGRPRSALLRASRGSTPGTARPATCRSRPRRPGTAPGTRSLQACARARRAGGLRRARRGRGRGAAAHSPIFRGGAFYPGAATVQPARLALGLRDAACASAGSRSSSARRSTSVRRRWRRRGRRDRARAGARRGRGARDRRRARRACRAAPPADRDLEPHRDHRAGARAARGDRLDRRRVHHRLAGDDPLLPHHSGRPDRVRLGRRPDRLRGADCTAAPSVDPVVVGEVRAPPASASSPGSRASGSSTPGAGRSTSRRPTCR